MMGNYLDRDYQMYKRMIRLFRKTTTKHDIVKIWRLDYHLDKTKDDEKYYLDDAGVIEKFEFVKQWNRMNATKMKRWKFISFHLNLDKR